MSKPPRIGLWKNERGPIASGTSGNIRFVIWENDKKGNDRAPDYHLVMEAPEKREGGRTPADADQDPFGGDFR